MTNTNYQTYSFTLTIFQAIAQKGVLNEQEVKMQEVFVEYPTVFDMRDVNFTDIEASAVDITSLGETSTQSASTSTDISTVPDFVPLPRLVLNQDGKISTTTPTSPSASTNNEEAPTKSGVPVPFVSSIDSAGNLQIGFTNPI